jgi:putative ABC transport system substrate-binding protein
MKRRQFIALVGGGAVVAAHLRAARAQQALPVIGYLSPSPAEIAAERLRMFRQGLKETGFVEGENVAIEYRWADNQIELLPAMADDLVRRKVAVLAATGANQTAFVAKAATSTIPVVFVVSEDPVRLGLVASLARPGGNLTGVNFLNAELAAKRLELLRELVPTAVRVAVLVNPSNPTTTEISLRDLEPAARNMGLQLQIVRASSSAEINAAFATFARERPDALFVGQDALFGARRIQLAHLATRHAIPTAYSAREYAEVGGLMSYGANVVDTYRQIGVITGRILKGAKPADLPVLQSTKLDLVINAETARAIGLTVPHSLIARADEVIE